MNSFSLISISDEIEIGILCCKKGLVELNKRSSINQSIFIPFLLLTTGFERLIKALYCCENYDKNDNSFPNQNKLSKKGHKLHELVDYIVTVMENSNYYMGENGNKSHYDYVKNNVHFLSFVKLLSDFATNERYYNLNEVSGKNDDTSDRYFKEYKVSPDRSFSEQITKYIQDNYPKVLQEIMQPPYDTSSIYSITNEHYNRVIQKFLKIYCFCCTQGAFGTTIRQFSAGKLDDFLFLKDEEISFINISL